MPKLPALSGKELVRVLIKNGFVLKRQSSSHFLVEHQDGRTATIPVHGNKDLPKGTLKGIIRDIEITTEQLIGMM